jgi:hypothetical protein
MNLKTTTIAGVCLLFLELLFTLPGPSLLWRQRLPLPIKGLYFEGFVLRDVLTIWRIPCFAPASSNSDICIVHCTGGEKREIFSTALLQQYHAHMCYNGVTKKFETPFLVEYTSAKELFTGKQAAGSRVFDEQFVASSNPW